MRLFLIELFYLVYCIDMSDIFFWNAKVSNTYFSFGSAVKKNKSFVEISAGNNTSFGM